MVCLLPTSIWLNFENISHWLQFRLQQHQQQISLHTTIIISFYIFRTILSLRLNCQSFWNIEHGKMWNVVAWFWVENYLAQLFFNGWIEQIFPNNWTVWMIQKLCICIWIFHYWSYSFENHIKNFHADFVADLVERLKCKVFFSYPPKTKHKKRCVTIVAIHRCYHAMLTPQASSSWFMLRISNIRTTKIFTSISF